MSGDRTFEMVLREFTRWMTDERGYARTTRSTRVQHVTQADIYVKKTFGRRLLMEKPEHVKAFLATLQHAKSRNGYLCDIRSFFVFARERGYRKTDPTVDIRRLPEPRYLPRPLSLEEARRLRYAAASLSLRHRVIVDLALFAGPRRAEIAALKWSDVDLQTKRIRFFGKGAKEGVVPLHDALVDLLRVWRIAEPSEVWVLPSYRGGHLRPASIWRAIKEAGERARISVTPHRLRHTFATSLLEAGSDIRVVQELLRHKALSSTQIYVAVSTKRLEADIDRLDYEGGSTG